MSSIRYQRPPMFTVSGDGAIGVEGLIHILKKSQRSANSENPEGDYLIHFACKSLSTQNPNPPVIKIIMDDNYKLWEEKDSDNMSEYIDSNGDTLKVARRTFCRGTLSNMQETQNLAQYLGWTEILMMMDEHMLVDPDGMIDYDIPDTVYLGIYTADVHHSLVADFHVIRYGISELPEFISTREPLKDLTYSKRFNTRKRKKNKN